MEAVLMDTSVASLLHPRKRRSTLLAWYEVGGFPEGVRSGHRLASSDLPPLSAAAVEAEIAAVRQERRGDHESRR
jgi:hypothetical protein